MAPPSTEIILHLAKIACQESMAEKKVKISDFFCTKLAQLFLKVWTVAKTLYGIPVNLDHIITPWKKSGTSFTVIFDEISLEGIMQVFGN